jgi:cyclopropane fatty-acyl-phospholipid synthase-like methyltransferase
MVESIVAELQLSREDHLLDLCCGNGLVSYELASHVARLTGIDFVERNIRTAQKRKCKENTTYVLGDARTTLSTLIGEGAFPNKCLMNGSLAYFGPAELDTILNNILRHLAGRSFRFLLTAIPRFDLKWNFYNTPERVARHLENEKRPDNTNDGVGRWWKAEEIEEVGSRHGLHVIVTNQPPNLSNFRMDALVTSAS